MPRPSLVDEIMRLVSDACTATGYAMLSPAMSKQEGRHYGDAVAATEAIRSRLTEIEQELASLRLDALQAESQRLGLYEEKDSVGRIEGGASLRRQDGAPVSNPAPHAARSCAANGIVQPSDLDASHSIPPECSPRHASLDEAFACERCNNSARLRMKQTSALPCTSEYVNAQSGYDGEQGG